MFGDPANLSDAYNQAHHSVLGGFVIKAALAFAALPPMLAGEGQLCVDYYEYSWKSLFHPKYWLRPVTKRLPKPALFGLLKQAVPWMLPISRLFGSVPLVGSMIKKAIPVANYAGVLPLNETQLKEWALLDTFDWLSPTYDSPQRASTAHRWMEEAGLQHIEILKAGHLVARGRKG